MNYQVLYTFDEVCNTLQLSTDQLQDELINNRLQATHFPFGNRITDKDLKKYIQSYRRPSNSNRIRRPIALAIFAFMLSTTAVAMNHFPAWQHVTASPMKSIFSNYDSIDQFITRWAPVDSPLQFNRYNDTSNSNSPGATHSVLSLQFNNEVNGEESYPWPLFVNLDTDHGSGDGVGGLFRLHNRDQGWSASTHMDGLAYSTGTTIGSNIEMLNLNNANDSVIGLNIQSKALQAKSAINIQTAPISQNDPLWQPGMDGSWETGIRFESGENADSYFGTGIHFGPNTYGQRGVWLQGEFEAGIDLERNNLRMNAGSKIEFEATGQVAMRYNPETYRIEILYGEEVIGFLSTSHRNIDLAKTYND